MKCSYQITTVIIFSIFLLGCSSKQPEQKVDNVLSNKSVIMNGEILHLKVSGYDNGGTMPSKFATKSGGGENISPGISWQNVTGAESYAMILDDINPVAHNWVHWLIADIPNTATEIPEGASRTNNMPKGSRELVTSWGNTGYDGPQPPVGSGKHEYVLTLYALDVQKLDVPENPSRSDFLTAIGGHVISQQSYSGFFER